MAELATLLLRLFTRAFYTTEHVLVVDSLIKHATLQDSDLAFVLGMQTKYLRKLCGKLKEDGILSSHSRFERRADGSSGYYAAAGQQAGKERMTQRDWYYLNYHRAIDSIKYRIHKLNKFVESKGSSTTEKKDLLCKRCKADYTDLEAMDSIDYATGDFLCKRCGAILVPNLDALLSSENEMMKRFNSEFAKLLELMQKIDAAAVPENDFETALGDYLPIARTDVNPASKKEIVDMPNGHVESSKGLALQPEKISVQVQDDADVRRESAAAEAAAQREKEARQNALPDWIAKSTVSGDITAVGAKEERLRREREVHAAGAKEEVEAGEKKIVGAGDEDVMAAYWEELAKAREKEAAEVRQEEDDDEDDEEEDDFEDVDVSHGGSTPAVANGTAVESSTATDDEREVKRVRINGPSNGPSSGLANGQVAEDTPAASDEDEELEFEEV